MRISGIETQKDLEDFIGELRDKATARGEDARLAGRNARVLELAFRATTWTASLGFVVGIFLLLLFAIFNIH